MALMNGHIRGLGRVPAALVDTLKYHVSATPSLWEADADKPNNFAMFADNTRHVVFQYPTSGASHTESYYTPLWASWETRIMPIIEHVVAAYAYEQGRTSRIMLARLEAGASIPMHIDLSAAAIVPHKVHVPLWTNKNVHFLAEKMAYHLREGIAYEVNNRIRHGGTNKGTADRIHLIFDYYDAAGQQV